MFHLSIPPPEAMTTEVRTMTLSSMNWVGMVGFLGFFLGPKCQDIVLGVCMYVCTSSRAHGRKCACVEIKEAHVDEISMCAEEDWFHLFFTSSVTTLCQISEQQKTLSWILLKQNKIIGALRNKRESARKRKWQASQETN